MSDVPFWRPENLNTTSEPAEKLTFRGPLLAKLPESESVLFSVGGLYPLFDSFTINDLLKIDPVVFFVEFDATTDFPCSRQENVLISSNKYLSFGHPLNEKDG